MSSSRTLNCVVFSCEDVRDTEDRLFIVDSGASMHNAEQRRIELIFNGYFQKMQKTHMRLTANGCSANKRVSKSFVHDFDLFENHLRTCHCHWHKPTKQTTSPLKFEPHMDRQCLIVCDPLTLVFDAPTYSYQSRPTETQTNNTSHVSYLRVHVKVLIHHTRLSETLEVPYSKVSERRSQDEVQIQSVMVRILVYCSFLSPHCVRIK